MQTQLIHLLSIFLYLLGAQSTLAQTAYYSRDAPTVATPSSCGLPASCGGVQVATAAQLAGRSLSANVYAATNGPVALRLPLTGTAPAGYRAGFLISNLGTALSVQTLGTITLRLYQAGTFKKAQMVDAATLQNALLTSTGDPAPLELISSEAFDAVELELGSALALGGGVRVRYAYAVPTTSTPAISGALSSFSSTTGRYGTGSCPAGVNNPTRAVDTDLTNYATFAGLATVSCTHLLQVSLSRAMPAAAQAGFVVGGTTNLLTADVLGGLTLRTYRNGTEQESGTGTSRLGITLLPGGQQYIYLTSTHAFDAVSIERTGSVTALDNLQLYYGLGTTQALPTQVRSNWDTPAGHYQTTYNTAICALCTVQNPGNSVDNNLGNKSTIQVGAGVANSVSLRQDLNGGGLAGQRAGVVVSRSALLAATDLERMILRSYDASGNLLESRTGASLLAVSTLPDGRQTVSFASTRDFNAVSLTVNGVTGRADLTDVYYASADNAPGIFAPSPLPVTLTSFQVQRRAEMIEVRWTTAQERNSARFVVERTTNPAAGFIAVGTVAATGTTSTPQRYSWYDTEAATESGPLYYRLRQEDEDGTFSYSLVQTVGGTTLVGLALFPNPAHGEVTLTGATPGTAVQVLDALGRAVAATMTDAAGSAHLPTGLMPGVYVVRVGASVERLVIE